MPNPGAIHVASIVSGTSDFDVSGSLRSYAALVSVAGAMTTSFRPTIDLYGLMVRLIGMRHLMVDTLRRTMRLTNLRFLFLVVRLLRDRGCPIRNCTGIGPWFRS